MTLAGSQTPVMSHVARRLSSPMLPRNGCRKPHAFSMGTVRVAMSSSSVRMHVQPHMQMHHVHMHMHVHMRVQLRASRLS